MSSKERQPLFSLSIASRIVLNIHALNNEGSENNRLIPRRVSIVVSDLDPDNGTRYSVEEVNAISGDMLKHIYMDHLRLITQDRGLPLCDACQALHSARMMGNTAFVQHIADKEDITFWDQVNGKPSLNPARVTDRLLTCVIDDLGGILIPAGDGIRRDSALDLGWITGLPTLTHTRQYNHTRHATHLGQRNSNPDPSNTSQADDRQMNTGQMLFHRPASSGVYAFTAHLSAYDIGYNRYARDYPEQVDGIPVDRAGRLAAALLAMAETVRNPKGALTSTQMPHITNCEGFISLSTSAAIAAPLVSPLQPDYLELADELLSPLERLHGEAKVQIRAFRNQAELLDITADIIEQYEPAQVIR